MKKWKKGLKRLTAIALAVMMVGTTTDFSAFAVSAAEGVSIECICETDDLAFHATNCPAYIAPENPQCYCAEKCTEDTLNVWCDVCGVQGVSACQGEDTAVAYEIVASGTCGAEGNESSVTWSLDSDGTLTISGTGAMADYELVDDYSFYYTTPWHDTDNDGRYQNSNIKKVVVEEGVTHIGNSAFKDFTELTSISIPNTVKSIGNDSVSYCYKLTSLVIPNSVTSIGENAFYENITLTSVTIGDSVETIGRKAFYGMGRTAGTDFTITLPKSVTYIAPDAFMSVYRGATIRYSCSYNEGNGYSTGNNTFHATLEKYHLCEYSSSGNEINCSGCTCGEYSSSTATLSLSSDEPIYYTGEEIKPAVTVTYPDGWGGDEIEPSKNNCNYSNNINAGTATCTFKYAEGVEASLDFTIQRATPTAEMFTYIENAVYDGNEKSANVVANQDITGMGEITIKYYQNDIEVTPVNVGTYTVKIDVADGKNYANIVGLEIGTFEITKVTSTADIFTCTSSAVYDGTAKSASVVARDGITGVGEITNIKYYQNGTEVTPINAGTYTVKIDVAEGDNYDAATDIEVGTFEITKATPTYDMFTATPSSELVYDGTEKSIIVTTDKEGMGTFNVSYVGHNDSTQPVEADWYIVRLHIEEGDNYIAVDTLSFVPFEIKKADSVITAAPTPADLVYDGTALNLINAGTTTDGEMQYSLDGTNYSSAIPTGTDAKTYTVWYKVVGDKNHNDTEPASIEVTIAKGTPDIGTVSASNMENTLDVSQVVLSRSNETVPGTLSLAEGTTLQYGIHDYTYVFKSGDANYNDVEGTVSITISDTNAPTATYKVGTDGWKQFINTITFGHFCKDYTTVDITYSDEGSGVADKQYYISEEVITNTETIQWSDYTEPLNINATGKYYIYVRVTDNHGNVVIQNSEGIVVYAESVIAPTSHPYEYGEEHNLYVNITTNGNTFANLTDGSGNGIATENYSIDGSTLTIKGEYLSDLDVGKYTYKICMNPQGVENTEVTLAYSFVVEVSAKELTVTGATATSRDYIANDKTVDITGIALSGKQGTDDVSVEITGLKGTLSSANAGTYTSVTLPTLTLTGDDAENYVLVQPTSAVATDVTINKLNPTITVGATEYYKTFGDADFTLDITDDNPEADVTYLSSDVNVVTVSNGTVTIKGAGTATITVSMAASTNYNATESKEITITVNKATAQNLAKGSKSYVYTESKTGETVTITGIPEDCGTVTYTYNEDDSSDMIDNISVSDGVLTYNVKALDTYTEGVSATIEVTIKMQNYNDLTYTYTITRSNCDHTEGKVVWDGNVATDKAPTCTETGIGHTSCTKAGCGEVVETGITIPALGHDYESEVTTKATYTAEGVRTYTCKREGCGDTYTESIPKLKRPSGSGSSSSTTNPPSTEAPITEEPSTEEPSTEEPSTEDSSTEDSSTEDSSTEEPGTSEEDTVEWKTDENGTFYEKEDGTKVTGWYEMAEDVWYYFDENGYRQTGWVKDGESWYYLSESGAMKTGWQKDGEFWYYLGVNGAMKTGWQKDGEFWYYLGVNGAMKTGWVKDGESWYYLSESGAMKTGWVKDGETWYYLSESGAMKTGWLKDGESWYYLSESGAMKTGWVKDGETWYYLSESGAMKTGWVKIGADWFYLNSNGSMAADTYIGKWYVDKNGYYIPSKTK